MGFLLTGRPDTTSPFPGRLSLAGGIRPSSAPFGRLFIPGATGVAADIIPSTSATTPAALATGSASPAPAPATRPAPATTVTAPPTTTTTVPPPLLPAPASIRPPRIAIGAGRGVWQPRPGPNWPAVPPSTPPRFAPPPATRPQVSPGSIRPPPAWRSTPALARPYGTWPQPGAVAASQLPSLLAAFPAPASRSTPTDTGWYDQGRTAVAPPEPGPPPWSSSPTAPPQSPIGAPAHVRPGPNVARSRQELTLLVDHGIAAPPSAPPASGVPCSAAAHSTLALRDRRDRRQRSR